MTSLENRPAEQKMSPEDFEKIVVEALESLPKVFKDKLENVDVVIKDLPTKREADSVGCSKSELLGLYEGVPLSKRDHQYSLVLPDKISLFRVNIERVSRSTKDMKRRIKHTVRHELAHHFGIDDERLEDLGIY
jgi:predicted Zn-dependent protease with MMP-like domain